MHRLAHGAFVAVIALSLLAAACGDDDTAATDVPMTAAAVAGPPCYGLPEVSEVPIMGGLAIGESHTTPGGGQIDLTGLVGCGLDGGMITVTADGVFDRAYMDDCETFSAADIPVTELRPVVSWACVNDPGNGDLTLTYTIP